VMKVMILGVKLACVGLGILRITKVILLIWMNR